MDVKRRRNDNARKLETSDRQHRNCVRVHPQNSLEHEKRKFEKCWELAQDGKAFVTEARFSDKDIRADIFVLDTGHIYEVESSDYELDQRKADYPDDKMTVIPLYDDEV